jgi:lysozyme
VASTLELIPEGFDILRAFEGDELKAYECPAGVWTIAEGWTGRPGVDIHYLDGTVSDKVIPGGKISKAESKRLTRMGLDIFEDAVLAMLKRPATPYQKAAMILLAWNIGLGAFKKSTVLRKFNAGDLAGASKAFEAWNKATIRGVRQVVKGLVRRRAAEQALFDGDIERAYEIAKTTRSLPMPQKVDAPAKAIAISNEPTVNKAAMLTGGTMIAGAVDHADKANEVLYTATSLKDTVLGFVDGLPISFSTIMYCAAGAAVLWFLWRGFNKWRDNEVDGDEHEMVEVEDMA